jgi:eukaryotic-like serine/threonine-protein kinase
LAAYNSQPRMGLAAGTKLGPYEILAFLGAGGMGEVYRARDVRLERIVAIKILKDHEANKSDAKERFEREARTISSLNHPNICHLYDVGEKEGVGFLVMEYLDGQTLADRLNRGPLPLDLVLKYGIEICDGLETAHRGGVIHRDLKPGNIMLTTAGLKLMDFGLAKPVSAVPSELTQTLSTPKQQPLTTEGNIVGTLQYMAPEQAEGKELDRRSDIFSLGAILYEMTTGKRAFTGNSQISVVSAILERSPASVRSLKPATPPALDHAITRCLAKDREDRWQTAHDVGLELSWVSEIESTPGVPTQLVRRRHLRERFAWVVAATLALACLGLALGFLGHPRQSQQLLRTSVLPPAGASFLPYNFAIAPNGSRLAFVAIGPDGKTALWVRGLSSADSQQLAGTEGAIYPFWSPDSVHVGFFAQGRLKTVDLVNSAVQTVCDAAGGFGGTWNREGVIVFSPAVTGPLFRVSASGGTPDAVTRIPPGSVESQHWPFFLPDGKHFLYVVNWSGPSNRRNGLYVNSIDNDAPQIVSSEIVGNVLFASSHLLYVRDRTIVAQPFDSTHLRTTGPAIPLTQPEVDRFFDFWQSGFSVSQEGRLVFQSAADSPSRLVWYDPSGKELGQFPEIGYEGPQFSPDGGLLAVYADDEHNGKHFIRIYNLGRGISSRLTDGGAESNPVWSPDGKSIAFRDASFSIGEVPADGSRAPQQLVSGTNVIPAIGPQTAFYST